VALTLIGDRARVRHLTVVHALDALRRLLSGLAPFDARRLDQAIAHRQARAVSTAVPGGEAVR